MPKKDCSRKTAKERLLKNDRWRKKKDCSRKSGEERCAGKRLLKDWCRKCAETRPKGEESYLYKLQEILCQLVVLQPFLQAADSIGSHLQVGEGTVEQLQGYFW